MKAFLLTSLLFSQMCYTQQIVGTDTTTASINIKTPVQVRFVETFDACVKTYDPQWADEEDTRSS